jgi:hemerythrin-like domain-containing protein
MFAAVRSRVPAEPRPIADNENMEVAMDALEQMTVQHERIRSLFQKYRDAAEIDDSTVMRQVQHEVFEALEAHIHASEQVFYPALGGIDSDALTNLVARSRQELQLVRDLMDEIDDIVEHRDFETKMADPMALVERHLDEEETEVFPQVRRHMDDSEREALGQHVMATHPSD